FLYNIKPTKLMFLFFKKLFRIFSDNHKVMQPTALGRKYYPLVKTAAVHEAGHAFGAYLANWKVKTVCVLHANEKLETASTEYNYGQDTQLVYKIETYLSNPQIFETLDGKEQSQVLEILDRRLILVHAGPIAEQKLNNIPTLIDVLHKDSLDLKRIEFIENFLNENNLDAYEVSRRAIHTIKKHFSVPETWEKVLALGEMLETENKKIDSTKVESFCLDQFV
ncbi:hypothetical protein DBR11_26480, partial [Pedobacter sp. HMWF019]|uniref:hypothetical protein n=1 Tax=Pedobacter sp. HMWF019 TaxID=2056856 RepID=UPI000D4529AC